jgi:hypothetical protein
LDRPKEDKGRAAHSDNTWNVSGDTAGNCPRRGHKLQVEAESAIDRIEEAERKKAEAEAEALAARTLCDILAIYFENHLDRNLKPGPSRQERKAQLTHLNPFLRSRIDAIKRSDLQMAVDRKAAEGRVVTAMSIHRGPT